MKAVVDHWEEMTNELFEDGFRVDEVIEIAASALGIYPERLKEELEKEGKYGRS